MVLLADVLIWIAFIAVTVLNIVAAILLIEKASDSGSGWYYLSAAVFGLVALLTMLYMCYIHKRIKFAAAHLKVAGHAIFRLPTIILVALVMVGVQISWTVVWVVSSLGIIFHYGFLGLDALSCETGTCETKYHPAAIFAVLCVMLLAYFWVTFVLRNVIGVTTAGTVAAWKSAPTAPCSTIGAWARALTLNLGSICLGSLIVAVLETVVWLLQIAAWLVGRSGTSCCCFVCLFAWLSRIVSRIERWIECFNRFAFAYVGCYSYSFVRASRRVLKLFAARGWSAIVNDHLIGNLCWLTHIVTGAFTAYVGIRLVHETHSDARLAVFRHPQVVAGSFCFVAGYSINTLVLAVLNSAVTTVFVLWAEDPHGWQRTRPYQYRTLHTTWLQIYPTEYRTASQTWHLADEEK
ncbi:unnamed protein product [Hyaloperonospora brassicae]|uniref:Choline transporter-like protein n=1 Tax=Hyaloperonospora brassicae TaxID=162125 RepID=A0AAV0V1V9_HYABA|nr:unnamed protein product [Hyaloperonospora brassicae]